MILDYIVSILVMLFFVSIFGYIFVVVKEKFYLKNNLIVIDRRALTQDHIEDAEIKEFVLGGTQVKSGDEIMLVLTGNKKIHGIVVGAKKQENSIVLLTNKDEVKKYKVKNITKLKIVSKYGKFFKIF